jgi:hypothetical protein
MSDENTGSDESQANEGGAQSDEVVSKSEFSKVVGQRQELKSKFRDALAKLEEYEAREKEREDTEKRRQGQFEELLQAEQAEKAEISKELERLKWGQRFNETVKAVAGKAGLDIAVTEGLLLREQQVSGADVAPEEVSDDVVAGLIKQIKSAAPALFEPRGVGGSPGAPGLNMANKKEGEASGRGKYYAMAQRLSAHNKRE